MQGETASAIRDVDSLDYYDFLVTHEDDTQLLSLHVDDVSLVNLEKKIKEYTPNLAEFSIGYIDPASKRRLKLNEDRHLLQFLRRCRSEKLSAEFVLTVTTSATTEARISSVDGTALSVSGALSFSVQSPTTPSPTTPTMIQNKQFDVMLSYNWDSQPIVLNLKGQLERRNFSVWMDLDQMSENIYQHMAQGVLQSKVIESKNCQSEIYYAATKKKPMVQVRMENISDNASNLALESMILINSANLYLVLYDTDWNDPAAVDAKMECLEKYILECIEAINNTSIPYVSTAPSTTDHIQSWLNPVDMSDEHERLRNDYVSGTRLWLIEEVMQWIANPLNRVLWLNGGAGVGKSIMAYLISDRIPQTSLGTVFYCRHNDASKNNAANVIRTIANGLSQKVPTYRDYLMTLLEIDSKLTTKGKPSLLSQSIPNLFQKLIVDGFKNVQCSKNLVIVIDALDECGKPGEDQRRELLSIVSEAQSVLPSFIKLIVTGRPELDIYASLRSINAQVLEPSSAKNIEDLQTFVMSRFCRLGSFQKEDVAVPAEMLVTKSEGVFVYARLVCDSIEAEKPNNARSITDSVSKLHSGMDSIYNHIFESCKDYDACLVMSTICHLLQPLSMTGISKLLGIEESRVGGAIIALRSILRIGADGSVSVIHKSLKDYITTPGHAVINFREIDIEFRLAECSLRVLNEELKFNMLDLVQEDLYRWHQDIPDFERRVNSIPDHVRYAGLYATSHLSLVKETRKGILETIDEIVSTKLLYWMELLSVMSRFSDFVGVSAALLAWCSQNNGSSKTLTLRLLSDAKRVCAQFGVPISACALQVYWSALPFSPVNSTFHQTFASAKWCPKGKYPALLQTQGIATQWSPCLCTCEGHTAKVNAVAISNDGDRIVSGSGDNTVKIWNANTGKEIRMLTGHTGSVTAVAISNDGDRIVSGSFDNTVKIWNANTGKEIRTLTGHTAFVYAVAISNDGDRI
ncbi:hypothetical protein HK098_007077, partial [Nowakowskiella sp. JEL0407]